MKHLILLLAMFCLFIAAGMIIAGCGNSVDSLESVGELKPRDEWQLQALEGNNVTFLEPDGDGLLIGTGEGLFQLKEGQFFDLGLSEYEIRGAVRMENNDIIAAVLTPDASSGDVTIFKRRNDRNSWEPFLNDYGGENRITFIFTLKSVSTRSDTLLAMASGPLIARSVNGGNNWEVENGNEWGSYAGYGTFIYSDPVNNNLIWAGGVTGISSPSLFKSEDRGQNWLRISGLNNSGDATTYDAISSLENSNWVLVGFGGSFASANNIKKTTDGGETWEISLAETGVHAFTRSISNPDLIFVSGRDPSTNLFFAFTTDFGETWEKEIFTEGPEVITTNDLEVLMIDGREVLFLATDQGLYSYTF